MHADKILTIVVSSLFALGAWAQGESSLTYSELAASKLNSVYGEVASDIGKLGGETLPHETKKLRKDIVAVRDYLDVFVYAFPAAKKEDEDIGLALRKDLDVGYETIGAFKDLFDM